MKNLHYNIIFRVSLLRMYHLFGFILPQFPSHDSQVLKYSIAHHRSLEQHLAVSLLLVLKLWTHRESNDIVLRVPVGSTVTIAELVVAKRVKQAKCCTHCMALQVLKLTGARVS